MSPERQAQLDRQQATQDEADIRSLEKFEPFTRYWMRRLKQKYAEIDGKFHAEKCTHEQREIYRQNLLMLEELIGMSKQDQISAGRIIDAQPASATKPVQVG